MMYVYISKNSWCVRDCYICQNYSIDLNELRKKMKRKEEKKKESISRKVSEKSRRYYALILKAGLNEVEKLERFINR